MLYIIFISKKTKIAQIVLNRNTFITDIFVTGGTATSTFIASILVVATLA